MASRHVLTVNQVLEIMLKWLESGDWELAFMQVIPKRKFPEAQDVKEIGSEEQESGRSTSDHESTTGEIAEIEAEIEADYILSRHPDQTGSEETPERK